jgi:hypothetical protein
LFVGYGTRSRSYNARGGIPAQRAVYGTKLVGHCEQEHDAALEALACMSPGEIAEMRQRFQTAQWRSVVSIMVMPPPCIYLYDNTPDFTITVGLRTPG